MFCLVPRVLSGETRKGSRRLVQTGQIRDTALSRQFLSRRQPRRVNTDEMLMRPATECPLVGRVDYSNCYVHQKDHCLPKCPRGSGHRKIFGTRVRNRPEPRYVTV